MGRGTSTLVLLVAALALGAYIYFVEADRPPAGTEETLEQVFDIESSQITSVTVETEDGQRTVLRKRDDRWRLVEPLTTNVNVTELVGLTSGLASLEIQRVVSEPDEAADLSAFGLDPPRIAVGFETPDTSGRLLIGARTPTGGDLYATVEGSGRVFLISGYVDGTFNRTTFDLRDKTILDFTQDQVRGLEITGDAGTIRLRKADTRWSLVAPIEAHADATVTDGLVGRLTTGQMLDIAAEETDELEAYGLAAPAGSVSVELDEGVATLLVGDAAPDGGVYARDTARPMVFTVDASLAEDVARDASEYRRGNLFAFRPFNATRLGIDAGGARQVFERVEADEGTDAGWRRIEPEPNEVDTVRMDDLLGQLANLRADGFTPTRDDTGLDAPVATVEVTFGDPSEEERVTIGRAGDDVFAVNGDEPGAAQVDAGAWDTILATLETL